MTFRSFENQLFDFLENLLSDPLQHSRWLNTLSFWENCGARKLAACQHPTKVKEEMLKHAAEEFRHAHFLKQQIHRLEAPYPYDYCLSSLLGGMAGYHYLDRLDIGISRLLGEKGCGKDLNYLLVTYAIERRAEEVYALYHEVLKEARSPIRIYSILLEEKEHLAEITEELSAWPDALLLCAEACQIEAKLCEHWLSCACNQLRSESSFFP